MKLEIIKDRILEAASKCSTAKETLKTLFPEVFEEENKVNLCYNNLEYFKNGYGGLTIKADGKTLMAIEGRTDRIMLGGKFNWEIKEEYGQKILIPTRK